MYYADLNGKKSTCKQSWEKRFGDGAAKDWRQFEICLDNYLLQASQEQHWEAVWTAAMNCYEQYTRTRETANLGEDSARVVNHIALTFRANTASVPRLVAIQQLLQRFDRLSKATRLNQKERDALLGRLCEHFISSSSFTAAPRCVEIVFEELAKGSERVQTLIAPVPTTVGEAERRVNQFILECYSATSCPQEFARVSLYAARVAEQKLKNVYSSTEQEVALASPSTKWDFLNGLLHRNRSLANQVTSEMLRFVDTGDNNRLKGLLDSIVNERYRGHQLTYPPDVLIVDSYRQPRINIRGSEFTLIDIIKEINKRTDTALDAPPTTTNQKLNSVLQSLADKRDKRSLEQSDLEQPLLCINTVLEELMSSPNNRIDPDIVEAAVWLRGVVFSKFISLSTIETCRAYRESWFHQMLKFEELTFSGRAFNAEDFDKFITSFKNGIYDGPGGVPQNDLHYQQIFFAYCQVRDRTAQRTSELGEFFAQTGIPQDTPGLWNGSILGLLLVHPYEARTNDNGPYYLRTKLQQYFHLQLFSPNQPR